VSIGKPAAKSDRETFPKLYHRSVKWFS